MNIYDTVNKLAYELKNSEEYKNYKKMREVVNEDTELKEKLNQFEKAQYEIQIQAIQQGKRDTDKEANVQNIYVELIQNEVMKKYFDAELKFNVILADINKIIGEAVSDVIK